MARGSPNKNRQVERQVERQVACQVYDFFCIKNKITWCSTWRSTWLSTWRFLFGDPSDNVIELPPRALVLPVYGPELTSAVKKERDVVYKLMGLPCPPMPSLANTKLLSDDGCGWVACWLCLEFWPLSLFTIGEAVRSTRVQRIIRSAFRKSDHIKPIFRWCQGYLGIWW